ncbi:MAG: hypothetical protein JWO19_4515 [Bryobacterales bacterium]|nr:hypothetical protein [Bryobacterales bacterium]
MRLALFIFVIGAALAQTPVPKAAAPKAAGPTFQTTGTLLQVMRGIMLPNSNIVFDAGNEPPKDDKGWLATQNAALTVAEAGNLLMIGNRAQGRPDWNQLAHGLIAAGQKTYKAALAKNSDALLDAGGDLTEACDACHKKYRDPQREAAEKAKANKK